MIIFGKNNLKNSFKIKIKIFQNIGKRNYNTFQKCLILYQEFQWCHHYDSKVINRKIKIHALKIYIFSTQYKVNKCVLHERCSVKKLNGFYQTPHVYRKITFTVTISDLFSYT